MAFYAINLWNNIADEFVVNCMGEATAADAQKAGEEAAARYKDSRFVRVVEAPHWNAAKALCVVTPLPPRRRRK